MTSKLLIASHNFGKVAEITGLLGRLDITISDLQQMGIDLEVEETGKTFEENAILKAKFYAEQVNILTLADDSGLEVDALDGRPGINTARYGGPGLTAEEKYLLLLKELNHVPWEKRTARFRCVVALADPHGYLLTAEGICPGFISLQPYGSGGFGYDPIFFLPELDLTMAQLKPEEKHKISHRGRAIQKILPHLISVI